MAQHSYAIADMPGLAFLADINSALSAIVTNNSGSVEPTETYAFMWWADTGSGVLKRRNAGNTAWISVMSLDLAVSTFAESVLSAANAAAARSVLGVAPRATRINVASVAGTVDLTLNAPNTDDISITGALVITGFTVAAGRVLRVTAAGAFTLPNNASIVTQRGADIVAAIGDTFMLRATAANVVEVLGYTKAAEIVAPKEIQPISVSMAGNAATLTLNPTSLDFRCATLGSGTVNTKIVSAPISTVISSGSTGGTVNGIAARIVVLVMDVPGVGQEVAWVNQNCGINLDETTLISTTAEGGAGGADSATTIYSTTARSNVPFRVGGFFDSTQVNAGTWVTPASTIQGVGGQALAAMASLGYGQKKQLVARNPGVTYYNLTGKPFYISAVASANYTQVIWTLDGVSTPVRDANFPGVSVVFADIIPPGAPYSYTITTGSLTVWETR